MFFYRHNRPSWRLRGTILIALFLFGHVTDFSLLTRLISSLGTRTSIEEFSREEKSIESFLRHSSPSNCTAERGRKFGLRNSALWRVTRVRTWARPFSDVTLNECANTEVQTERPRERELNMEIFRATLALIPALKRLSLKRAMAVWLWLVMKVPLWKPNT